MSVTVLQIPYSKIRLAFDWDLCHSLLFFFFLHCGFLSIFWIFHLKKKRICWLSDPRGYYPVVVAGKQGCDVTKYKWSNDRCVCECCTVCHTAGCDIHNLHKSLRLHQFILIPKTTKYVYFQWLPKQKWVWMFSAPCTGPDQHMSLHIRIGHLPVTHKTTCMTGVPSLSW